MPTVGRAAPPFTLATDTGAELSLRDLAGTPVILYFYPKDDTTGCTAEACGFRDAFPKFKKSKAVVLGVSPDSVRRHRNFKAKHGLPFTLLSDPDHAVCERYGVWKQKSMFGHTYMGVERTTFLIDARGRIARIFEKVKPDDHAEEVAAALDAL